MPIGLYAHRIINYSLPDSDMVVPTLLADPNIFNPFLSSFLALSMIAAAMSSLDSVLLVMASTFHRDIISINKGEILINNKKMDFPKNAKVLILWPLTPYNGLIHKVFPAIILSTILYIAFTLQKADTSDKRVPKLFSN